MKLPLPIGLIKMPKEKINPGSFVIRAKGGCMDSPKAEKQIKDGDYLLIHPIPIDQSIGKVVVLNLPTALYTKQLIHI